MLDFELCIPTKIYFGRGQCARVGEIIASRGYSRVLICYGGGSVVRTGLLERVKSSLDAVGVEHDEFGGIQANPTSERCAELAHYARERGSELLLAVGGGSVIDTAKMAAHCVRTGLDPWDYTEHRAEPSDSLPVGVVLTIAATGSETSDSAVLTNTALGVKRGLSSEKNRPLFAIMDPELTMTLPPYQTACGVVDILMHTMERYMCTNPDNELIDRISEGLLTSVIDAGRRAMAEPGDYEARATLMLAGSLSHNGLTGAGRACGLWTHKLEHEMSALDERIAHGAGLAVVWPAYLEFFARHGLFTERLERYAEKIWGVSGVENGIEATREYFRSLGMPERLSDFGLTAENAEYMSRRCTDEGRKFFPSVIPLGLDEVREIFSLCL